MGRMYHDAGRRDGGGLYARDNAGPCSSGSNLRAGPISHDTNPLPALAILPALLSQFSVPPPPMSCPGLTDIINDEFAEPFIAPAVPLSAVPRAFIACAASCGCECCRGWVSVRGKFGSDDGCGAGMECCWAWDLG
jgi:hypothetical protein